jgi:RNA polymerase sigma factor (sigma-70 family)
MKIDENRESLYQNIHQELIDKCRKGDQKAQFQIYKLYYRSMYNTSLRILGDTQEAEDIMQESFLEAFDKIGTYSGRVSFGAWLKRIVINQSLDALRKRKIGTDPVEDYIPSLTQAEETAEENGVSIGMEQIRKAIQQLPDGYRLVLSLYLLEGYDHEEIGQILGISASTSRSQFTRAKQKLMELVRKEK